jgi:outer membrane protein TolC
MRRTLVLTLAGLVWASAAAAQAPTPGSVTFDEAIARALARNPTVARAATAIARADALLAQARAVTLPNVSARFTNVTLDRGVSFDENDVVPQNQFTFAATASMPVLAPAAWARRAQARDQVEVATAGTAEVRQQVAVATAQAYLAVIAARRQVDVDARALDTARAHLDYAQARLQGGLGSRLNMLRAAQAASTEASRLENTRFGLRQAQEALGVLLVEDGPVDAASEPRFEIPADLAPDAWRTTRPDLIARGTLVRAAERVLRDSWKDVAPEGTVSFDPQYVTPAGLFQPSRSWRLTFSVTQPIFLGGLQGAVSRERQVRLDETRLAVDELEIRARSEIRVARAAAESAERALASAEQAAGQASEVLEITTTAFEVGATTNIEVIDAQRAARDAATLSAVAADALRRARLDLLVALGRFPGSPSAMPSITR